MVFAQFNYRNIYQVLQPTFFQTKCKQICTVNIPDEPRFLGMQWTRCPNLKVQLEQKVLAVHCSAQMLSKDAIEREAYGPFLIPHAVPLCYFLTDPRALVNTRGSRPHPKPAAIKMSNDRLSVFLLQTSQPKWGSREVLRTSSEPETQRE